MTKTSYPEFATVNGVVVATLPPSKHGFCPSCGCDLDGGGIWLHFFHSLQIDGYWLDEDGGYLSCGSRRKLTPEEAMVAADDVAESYGADRTNGRWGRAIGIVMNDRASEHACPDCGEIWNTYTGQLTGENLKDLTHNG